MALCFRVFKAFESEKKLVFFLNAMPARPREKGEQPQQRKPEKWQYEK
jgi:hypothetical protein